MWAVASLSFFQARDGSFNTNTVMSRGVCFPLNVWEKSREVLLLCMRLGWVRGKSRCEGSADSLFGGFLFLYVSILQGFPRGLSRTLNEALSSAPGFLSSWSKMESVSGMLVLLPATQAPPVSTAFPRRPAPAAAMGLCPSGQYELVVSLSALMFGQCLYGQ